MDRETILTHAQELGMDVNELKRLPTYVISEMMRKKSHGHHHHHHHKSKHVEKVLLEAEVDEDEDDNVTVVDMDHMTAHSAPSDQKYQRFCALTDIKKKLQHGLKTNRRILDEHKDRMDADDVLTYQDEIRTIESHLKAADVELLEIDQWFREAYRDRLAFYQTLVSNTADVTGKVTDHFQHKIANIQKYMDAVTSSNKQTPNK